ncbi:MAG: SMP-30/gluconolactonase/LRE family protein, partial [Bauldia sp.]
MKKPIKVCTGGLGHPEGPYELDDGRVVYANSYASAIGVWDPKTNKAGIYADVGGGPNACMLGSDGAVYSTQYAKIGGWIAPVQRPPSIQKTLPNGKVEILVTEADGVKFDGPNDLTFAPDGRLWFTDSGDWAPDTRPHPGRIVVIEKNGKATIVEELDHVYPNGIVAEPDGSIVWVESYTLRVVRRTPDGKKSVIHTLPEGHIPDGLKIDVDGNFWITTVVSGGVDVIARDGKPIDFLESGGTILNCAFGKG